MTNFITTHFDERGEAHVDILNLDFDINPEEVRDLMTKSIYFKSEDKELIQDLKQLASTQS